MMPFIRVCTSGELVARGRLNLKIVRACALSCVVAADLKGG